MSQESRGFRKKIWRESLVDPSAGQLVSRERRWGDKRLIPLIMD